MTTAITIIAIISAVVAAIFTTLYLYRPEGRASLIRIDAAQQEIGRLKATIDSVSERLLPVTPERILSYLTEEKRWKAVIDENDPDMDINFCQGDSNYRIHTLRLPQVILSKGYNMSDNNDIDWDALKQAAWMTTLDLVMVKFHIWEEQKAYDQYIVSHEWDMNDFEKSLDKDLDIIKEAEDILRSHYHEILSEKNKKETRCVYAREVPELAETERKTIS